MSPQTLIEPRQELDSRQQFLESYASIVKIYQELVPLDNRLENHEKRLQEIKSKSHRSDEDKLEVLVIKKQVDRASELHERLDKIPEEIRKLRTKDTSNSELSVLDGEVKTLILAEKFKAEFQRDKSQLPIERRVAADAFKAIELAENEINKLRAEISGSSGIDELIKQHLR
jgi:hypothetical protein